MGRKNAINYLCRFAWRTMSRACLALAFAFICLIVLPPEVRAQPNSEKASQVSGPAPEPPVPPKAVKDSVKAAKAKAKAKKAAAAAAADTSMPAATVPAAPAQVAPSPSGAASVPAPSSPPSAMPAPGAASTPASQADSAKGVAPGAQASTATPEPTPAIGETLDSAHAQTAPSDAVAAKAEPVRAPQDLRLFNDPPLIGREYGFAILGSVVAGTLGFYIGSGIETAIVGDRRAHKGTLSFTGIRYDNFKGAFWGGASGMVLGSALTTYFTGQTDEEDGGFFATLAGTTAAAAGAFYLASVMGVNDDIDWKPFMPLLAIPSLGGTLGFNLSRWHHDKQREKVVAKEAAVRLHAPDLALGFGPDGERVQLTALRLTF
jgi:hypothetical protein